MERNPVAEPIVYVLYSLQKPPSSAMSESTPPDRIAITIEITPEQKARLERLAEQQGVSPDTAVRAVVERGLEASRVRDERGRTEEESQTGSFLDGLEHLVGSVEGPSDLSSNPDHMKGYGRS